MSAFTPPATSWCPDCARERVSCRHLDDRRVATDGGRRTLVSDYRTDSNDPATTFEDAEACEECGKANAGVRAADGRALCGTCHQQATGDLVTDGSGLVDDTDVDDAETPDIDRARDAHPKWLELVSAASRRDKGRVERLADELRGDLTFIERTIDDLAGGDDE